MKEKMYQRQWVCLQPAIAVGGFGGSIIAGILTDMGLLNCGNPYAGNSTYSWYSTDWNEHARIRKEKERLRIEVPGMIALIVSLCGILLALNFGSSMGWTNPMILAGLVIGIIALIALVKIENKAAEPLIPMKLFKNKNYTVLLIVGFICYFYQNAMNYYGTDRCHAG